MAIQGDYFLIVYTRMILRVGLGRKQPYLGLKGLLSKPRNDRLTSGILDNMFYFEYMSIVLK
jgi:hypothetical protein